MSMSQPPCPPKEDLPCVKPNLASQEKLWRTRGRVSQAMQVPCGYGNVYLGYVMQTCGELRNRDVMPQMSFSCTQCFCVMKKIACCGTCILCCIEDGTSPGLQRNFDQPLIVPADPVGPGRALILICAVAFTCIHCASWL